MSQFEKDFDSARSERIAREEAEQRRRDAVKQAEIDAARKCIRAIIDEFATDKRYGGSLSPQVADVDARTATPEFQFLMSGSRVDLAFFGRTKYNGTEVPDGVSPWTGITTELRVVAQTPGNGDQEKTRASNELPIQVKFEADGSCTVLGLYYTVSRAAAELA